MRNQGNKLVDCQDNLQETQSEIQHVTSFEDSTVNMSRKLEILKQRRVGGALIRMSTPIEKFSRGQVQSPSNDKSDMMVYPNTDLATYEKE